MLAFSELIPPHITLHSAYQIERHNKKRHENESGNVTYDDDLLLRDMNHAVLHIYS